MVDMKFLFPILFVMAVVSVQAQNSVRLKGKLVGMGTDLVKLSYDGATSVIGDEGSFMIRTDREGHFDIFYRFPNRLFTGSAATPFI